jgi:hypothetical protein
MAVAGQLYFITYRLEAALFKEVGIASACEEIADLMESVGSLQCSQQIVTVPCLKPAETYPKQHISYHLRSDGVFLHYFVTQHVCRSHRSCYIPNLSSFISLA